MIVEVINTGTELLLGDILNTNFQYLSKALNQKGFDVLYQTTVVIMSQLREVIKDSSIFVRILLLLLVA